MKSEKSRKGSGTAVARAREGSGMRHQRGVVEVRILHPAGPGMQQDASPACAMGEAVKSTETHSPSPIETPTGGKGARSPVPPDEPAWFHVVSFLPSVSSPLCPAIDLLCCGSAPLVSCMPEMSGNMTTDMTCSTSDGCSDLTSQRDSMCAHPAGKHPLLYKVETRGEAAPALQGGNTRRGSPCLTRWKHEERQWK